MMNRRHRCVLACSLGLAALSGCGGRIEPEAPPEAGVVDALESGREVPRDRSDRTFVEQCYTPGKQGNPGTPCLRTEDPRLPGLFRECREPEEIRGDPIYDVNVTTGFVRCCYEVSDESCKF